MDYCKDCINAKVKSPNMWYCPKHRTNITFYTLCSAVLVCKGKDFRKAKP